jgi:hypothetical protein
MMTRLWLAVSLLVIAGCDQRSGEKTTDAEWVIVPATLVGGLETGTPLPKRAYAWKINAKTGELRFCEYQEDTMIGGKFTPPSLDCSTREQPGFLQ